MTPQTPAGRALLEHYRVEGSPMKATVNLVNGIAAIEREAKQQERERIRLAMMLFQFNPDPPIEQAAEAADREAAGNAGPTATGFAASGFATSAAADLDAEALTAVLMDFGYDYPPKIAQKIAAAYAAAMKERA